VIECQHHLKELVGWSIVKSVHVIGDRRDHFDSMKDVWEMFRNIVDERKKRDADPHWGYCGR
jgi:DNA-binding transcriptional regulator GbsR (MarR family)